MEVINVQWKVLIYIQWQGNMVCELSSWEKTSAEKLMKLSNNAGLSRVYTNHLLRASSITFSGIRVKIFALCSGIEVLTAFCLTPLVQPTRGGTGQLPFYLFTFATSHLKFAHSRHVTSSRHEGTPAWTPGLEQRPNLHQAGDPIENIPNWCSTDIS